MHCGAAATTSCFRFAGAGQAMRLLATRSEILPSRRRSRCWIGSADQFFPRALRRSLRRHSSIEAGRRQLRCRGFGSESTELMINFPARSDRASVTGAFKKDWHRFKRRFNPPFFRSHESPNSHKSYAIWVNLFFDEPDNEDQILRFCIAAQQRFERNPECVHGPYCIVPSNVSCAGGVVERVVLNTLEECGSAV